VDLRANWNDRTFQYCLYATYGYELSNILSSRRTPFVFLDIGANQGLFSLIAAKNSACIAAIAFEPVSKTFELLKANIEANQLGARITPVPAGISEKAKLTQISVCHTHSGSASLRNGSIAGGGETETVELICHDELDSMLPPNHPIIVKIDVEGHEEIVIRELLRSVHRDRFDAIFYEIDERWVNPDAIHALLKQHGFDRFTRFGIGRHYDTLAQR
jgi:FkbM family methyltransferase